MGEPVRDLQRRLAGLGFDTAGDATGAYGSATAAAVEGFQRLRGLRVDGVCGRFTWAALVEAGYRLGDRLLYLRSPMLRGDDVADLQRRLGALGFNTGRVDGILGPQTEEALKDFQRNAGLTTDGILGPESRVVLERVTSKTSPAGGAPSVAGVREKERLRAAPRTLAGRWVVIGETGGLEQLVAAAGRAVQDAGALVLTLHEPDGSIQAQTANEVGADLYVGLAARDEGCTISYYATAGFESAGGRRLATLLGETAAGVLGVERCEPVGMTLPILRETRMPAVVCEVGPPSDVVVHTGDLARAVATAVDRWAAEPIEG